MSDKRSHRGPHPDDASLFGQSALPVLRAATRDYCWLLDRGYAHNSSLKLVGDRYRLMKRQRLAIARVACDDKAVASRTQRQLTPPELAGKTLLVDGFNVLVTLEAALSGGVVLAGRDGCFRDMASMHGTYRRVAETTHALTLLGEALESLGVVTCQWLFDRPVSNSGRAQALARDLAREHGWSWEVQLVQDPDRDLVAATDVIASADSGILNRCGRWFSLAQYVVERQISTTWLVDFRGRDSDVL